LFFTNISGLSQNLFLPKIIITPTLKGVMIFSDFLPLGSGQKVDENPKGKTFETASGAALKHPPVIARIASCKFKFIERYCNSKQSLCDGIVGGYKGLYNGVFFPKSKKHFPPPATKTFVYLFYKYNKNKL